MPSVSPVASALPPNRLPQAELRAAAEAALPDRPGKQDVLAVFDNARIDERSLAMPLEWYLERHGHKERADVYQRIGLDLLQQVAEGALATAKVAPEELDGILLVSTTGLATPSLDARLMNRLPFRPDLVRLPMWGLGCAGGVAGLNRAADLARAHPDGLYLLACVELCSLLFDIDKALAPGAGGPDKKSLVAASLFADGAAGCVVAGDATGVGSLRHVAGQSHLFPDSGRVMGWDVQDHNLEVVLSPRIPDIVRSEAARLAAAFAVRHGAQQFVLHPGGAKVLDAYQEALALPPEALSPSREALRKFGNLSSPTVLFALREAVQAGRLQPGDRAVLGALGPGFASELAVLEA